MAAAILRVRVARAIHAHWHRLSAAERRRLEPLADDVRQRALDLRGHADSESAGHGLRAANERLAGAMVRSAEADPEVSETEVTRLREDLARELERLASGEIAASRPARKVPEEPGSRPSPAPRG
ncbi:MAG: hypothetical protein AABM31_05280 [Actinomycetota bacterium]